MRWDSEPEANRLRPQSVKAQNMIEGNSDLETGELEFKADDSEVQIQAGEPSGRGTEAEAEAKVKL